MITLSELSFEPDELGEGFERAFVELGTDPDGETPIRFTLVRYAPEELDGRPALFFVHGMTDYFFQAHVARYFHELGYAIYGVDLRKCGRSWRPGQTWHHVSSQSLYDAELSLTLRLLADQHPKVVAVGHSTGGLDVTMWAARLRVQDPELHARLSGVMLNSPWFALQFDPVTKAIVSHVFPILAKRAPMLRVPGGINPAYGRSLHASEHGEWDYNLEFKPLEPRPKYVSWLAGVMSEIKELQSGRYDTGVPTLLLCSDNADIILNPAQMRENAHNAHPETEVVVLPGALHDVFLSPEQVRTSALEHAARWLETI
ncbi:MULTISPECIES: alpha/beta hydrolase [Corynebacterium]|nr:MULTISPECIES: alpha/beta hydrolase [Corynebacterium]